MSDPIEQAAEILYQHTYVMGAYECSCQSNEDYPDTMGIDEWKTHAALALADAGIIPTESAAIERVRALHHPTDWPTHAHATCPTCVTWNHEAAMGDEAATPEQWPCPTIRALDAG